MSVSVSMALPLLSIAGAVALGAVSPGPSFLMVARTAVAHSRAHALAAAAGMGVGGVLFALAALLGLQALLLAVPVLYVLLKLCGGAYLLYLGMRLWRGARHALSVPMAAPPPRAQTRLHAFSLALATQLSNPKAAIVYASVFAAFLPRQPPPALSVLLPMIIFVIESGWYAIVAVALSAAAPRAAYLSAKGWVDRIAGSVMMLLGVKLIATAHQA